MANSWISVGNYITGQVEILKSTARSSSYDIVDSSVSTTAGGETADFQSLAGTDVSAVIILVRCDLTSTQKWGILKTRELGDTGDNDGDETLCFLQSANGGSSPTGTRSQHMLTIPCSGVSSGKFEYWTTAGQTVNDGLIMIYWGRIRR